MLNPSSTSTSPTRAHVRIIISSPENNSRSPPVMYVRRLSTAITVKVKANMSFKKIFEAAEVSALR